MAAKTKKKTVKEIVPITKVVELLESLVNQGEEQRRILLNLDQNVDALANGRSGSDADVKVEVEADTAVDKIGKTEDVKKDVIINQAGETVELTYESVRAEAQKLVSIDEHTEQRGFAKAREIILGFGVARLEDVLPVNYPEVISKVRKAIIEWKL